MIFVLARVLGGDVNYSQCLGVIGYSVLPLFVVGLILPVTHSLPWLHFIIKVSRTKGNADFFDLQLLSWTGNSCIQSTNCGQCEYMG